MRVALISLHFSEYAAHLAAALAVQNDVLLILYSNNAHNELDERLWTEFSLPRLNVLVVNSARNVIDVFTNTGAIASAVTSFRPEIIHLQEGVRDELVLALPVLRRYPMVMTIHDPSAHSGKDAESLRFSRHRVYRGVLRRTVRRVFVHGEVLAREAATQLPWLHGRIHSVPHGPLGPTGDLSVSQPAPQKSYLFFGRLHEYKGLRFFIEAIQRLRTEGLPVVGVIAGRGSDLQPNRRLIDRVPEAFDVIERYISEREVRMLFTATTAVVLPYIDGTQSGVAAMALGYGRPVIATRVGSIPELVRDDVNGILIPPRDIDSLVEAMRSLAQDGKRWRKLADGARSLRSGVLSWHEIAATTIAVYRETLRT